jgi:hypothetical protein
MSNPTVLSECTAEQVCSLHPHLAVSSTHPLSLYLSLSMQAFEWTDGNVTFASGSPFDDVTRVNSAGAEVTHRFSQAVGQTWHCAMVGSIEVGCLAQPLKGVLLLDS